MLYLITIAIATFVLNGLRHAERQTGEQYTIIAIALVSFSVAQLYFGYVAA